MKKIVIIENEKSVGSALGRLCELNGFQAVVSYDHFDGVKAIDQDTVLVILSLNFPDNGGAKAIERIRLRYKKDRLKIIVSSNKAETDKLKQMEALGIDDFIIRPIERDVMISKISKLLNGKSGSNFYWLPVDCAAKLKSRVIDPEITIIRLSETSITVRSNTAFHKDGALSGLDCVMLNALTDGALYELKMRVETCEKIGNEYFVTFNFIEISESVATSIRSIVVKGAFVGDKPLGTILPMDRSSSK